jgi:hypothetical protein
MSAIVPGEGTWSGERVWNPIGTASVRLLLNWPHWRDHGAV